MDIEFEWDDEKDRDNIRDHGLSLFDGEDVFYDPFRMVRRDDDSSENEERWQTMGLVGKVLFVVYTERREKTRIISVRIAEPADFSPIERRIIMAIVTHTRRDGIELTLEEKAAWDKRLEAAEKRPYVYDPDCPLLTLEQLAEFRPANFPSMEARERAMRDAGVLIPDAVPLEAVSGK